MGAVGPGNFAIQEDTVRRMRTPTLPVMGRVNEAISAQQALTASLRTIVVLTYPRANRSRSGCILLSTRSSSPIRVVDSTSNPSPE